jgi:hypothetical protein
LATVWLRHDFSPGLETSHACETAATLAAATAANLADWSPLPVGQFAQHGESDLKKGHAV